MEIGQHSEQVEIRTGLSRGVLTIWCLVLVLFGIAVGVAVVGAIFFVAPMVAGKISFSDIPKAIGAFASLDGRKIQASGNGGMVVAGALVIAISLLLALLLKRLLTSVQNAGAGKKTVMALLPGLKRNFIPAEEGLYTQQLNGAYTGFRTYLLRPWESLQLYDIDEKKGRLGLMIGKSLVRLKARTDGDRARNFDDLKQVVFGHLPTERQVLTTKRVKFRWGVAIAAILVLLVSQVVAAAYLEGLSKGAAGDNRCDICNVAGVWPRHMFILREGSATGKLVHEYCELHGVAYSAAHPITSIASIVITVRSMLRPKGLMETVNASSSAAFGLMFWYFAAIIVIFISAPKIYHWRQ